MPGSFSFMSMALTASSLLTQGVNTEPAAPDTAKLRAHLDYLCNDECAGRKVGTEGERIAGNYIAGYFKELGLEPMKAGGSGGPTPYHQAFNFSGKALPVEFGVAGSQNGSFDEWQGCADDQYGTAYNIAGVVPGTDAALKSEYIFLVAHYDHMGKSGAAIYRGAGDNAAGTACIMDLARIFKGRPARRSLAFLAFSGEEGGCRGSKAYVKNPTVPLSAIKGVINLDMVGRNDDTYLNIIIAKTDGIVSTLTRDGREACARHGITPAAGPESYAKAGGDSATFVMKGIPSIWFDCGMFPDYHKATDTVDKLSFPKIERTTKIARDLTEKVANEDKAPEFLPKSEWSQWEWAPNMEGDRAKLKEAAEELALAVK